MSEEKYLLAIITVPIKITNYQTTILPEYSYIKFENTDKLEDKLENTTSLQTEKIISLFETILIPGSQNPPEKLIIQHNEIKKHRTHKSNISFKNKNHYTSKYTVKNYSR